MPGMQSVEVLKGECDERHCPDGRGVWMRLSIDRSGLDAI